MALKAGNRAPQIELTDQNGKIRRSKDLRGKLLVLFFYPKDETPGCTAEACGFRDEYTTFKELGAEVWGVSADSQESHLQFAKIHNLPFPLLVDKNNSLRKKFEVPGVLGVLPGRVTYIIDGSGTILHIFNNLLNGPAHVKQALKIARENTSKR